MIVAERKPFEEIQDMLKGYERVLLVGCGVCVSVCFAGGDREVQQLVSQLKISAKKSGKNLKLTGITVERQCELEFVDEAAKYVDDHDIIMSMACGAGAQLMAERFPGKIVVPAVNTTHLGVMQAEGVFTEKCLGCGECVLERFGGICPVTRCSKSIFNGPCGGSQNGKCEVDSEMDCGWQLIIDRMKSIGQLERLTNVEPPKNWSKARHGGPRKTVLKEHML